MMRLSPNFTLAELTVTSKAIPNQPNAVELENLRYTAQQMERVRVILKNSPIIVSSGFRSEAVNLAIGGSENSAHMLGLAVDFTSPRFGPPRRIAEAIRKSSLLFDQLIFEFPTRANGYNGAWIHLGFSRRAPRRQTLTAYRRNGRTIYTAGLLDATALASLVT